MQPLRPYVTSIILRLTLCQVSDLKMLPWTILAAASGGGWHLWPTAACSCIAPLSGIGQWEVCIMCRHTRPATIDNKIGPMFIKQITGATQYWHRNIPPLQLWTFCMVSEQYRCLYCGTQFSIVHKTNPLLGQEQCPVSCSRQVAAINIPSAQAPDIEDCYLHSVHTMMSS